MSCPYPSYEVAFWLTRCARQGKIGVATLRVRSKSAPKPALGIVEAGASV